jgi:hypothetical protein
MALVRAVFSSAAMARAVREALVQMALLPRACGYISAALLLRTALLKLSAAGWQPLLNTVLLVDNCEQSCRLHVRL